MRMSCFSLCVLAFAANAEDVAELSTIAVTGSSDNGPVISTQKLLKIPGAGGDPLKAIEAMPGVTLGGFGPFNLPSVRGSSPADNSYITDFVPVGYVFHNDGSSTYNENLVEDFQIKTGAWSPEYNNALGAVLVTRLRDPYREAWRTTADISFLRAGILVEGAVSDDQALYFSYRESLLQFYVDNFVDEKELSFTEVPTNHDYQFKYHWQLDPVTNLRFTATGARDKVGIEFGPESKELEREPGLAGGLDANTFYDNQSVLFDHLFNNGTSQEAAITRKVEDIGFHIGDILNLDVVSTEYRVKSYFRTPLRSTDALRYGVEVEKWNIDYSADGKFNACASEVETCPPASLGQPYTTADLLVINGQRAFIAYDWLATPDWQLSPGLMLGKNDYTKESDTEFRLESRYELNSRWTLTAAFGQHSEFPRQFQYILKDIGNPDLEKPTAEHYVAGFEFKQDSLWSSKLEAYYKDLHKIIVSNAAYESELTTPDVPKYLNDAEGYAYGLEWLINKNLADRWYGWFSISYAQTKRTNNQNGEEFLFAYDRPWTLNAVASYEWDQNWSVGLRWRYQSGALTTPVQSDNPSDRVFRNTTSGNIFVADDSYTPAADDEFLQYSPNYAKINSRRLPAYHRLDIRADRTFKRKNCDLDLYWEIINLYNRLNVSDYNYSGDYTEREDVVSLPTIFSVGIKATF